MAITNTTIQDFSTVFAFLKHFKSLVLWVRSPDYQKQIYVSDSYEKIWLRSSQELYDEPDIFMQTIVPDHQQRLAQSINLRVKPQFQHQTTVFQIAKSNGVIQCIRDNCFTLTDGNKKVAIAGVGECIPQGEYDAYLRNEHTESTDHHAMTDDILGILLQEYALEIEKNNEADTKKKPNSRSRTIDIDDQKVKLTPREYQCIQHLLNGMSAKQTAYEMNLSQRTVESYLNNIRDKTSCRNKIVLVNQIRKYNPQLC